jgi:hypothetical protein
MGERVACPECGRYVGITPLGFVRRHLATGSDAECRASRLTLAYVRETVARPQIPSRPTVLTMDGETGSDGRGACPSERSVEGVTYQCVLDDGHDPRHVFGEHRWGKLCDCGAALLVAALGCLIAAAQIHGRSR